MASRASLAAMHMLMYCTVYEHQQSREMSPPVPSDGSGWKDGFSHTLHIYLALGAVWLCDKIWDSRPGVRIVAVHGVDHLPHQLVAVVRVIDKNSQTLGSQSKSFCECGRGSGRLQVFSFGNMIHKAPALPNLVGHYFRRDISCNMGDCSVN